MTVRLFASPLNLESIKRRQHKTFLHNFGIHLIAEQDTTQPQQGVRAQLYHSAIIRTIDGHVHLSIYCGFSF